MSEAPAQQRTSGRKRQRSWRVAQAEEHAKHAAEEKEKEKSRPKAKRGAPKGNKRGKVAAGKKVAPPTKGKMAPHVLAIVVYHTNEQDNTTSFHIAPKARLTKRQLETLDDCHHGGLNDDEERYKEVSSILDTHFKKKDEIYYEKEEIKPVKVNCFIAEVYHMHFGGFQDNYNEVGGASY